MIIQIVNSEQDLNLLKLFLSNAGDSLVTFRYFSTRPLEIIKNHKYTIILLKDKVEPVAYGHLDPEGGIIWLGICVSEKHIGNGYGSLIMTKLLKEADSTSVKQIFLQVDKDNINAVNLYKKFNFEIVEEKEGLHYLMRRVKNEINE